MLTITTMQLSMSNIFLLSGERHILVDCGSPGEFGAIRKRLKRQGLDFTDLALILITHAHFDHCGNAAAIQQMARCPLAVHRLDQPYLASGKNAAIVPTHPLAAAITPFMRIPFAPAQSQILIEDQLDLAPFGVDAQVLATPGHTPGSISVLTHDNGAAIVGDLIGGGWPLGQFQPEKPRYHYWASSLTDVSASLKAIFSHRPGKIYVGHGGPLDGERARQFFTC